MIYQASLAVINCHSCHDNATTLLTDVPPAVVLGIPNPYLCVNPRSSSSQTHNYLIDGNFFIQVNGSVPMVQFSGIELYIWI